MSLNPEWLRRVTNWRDELPQHFYRPLSVIELSGFVTKDQLTPDETLAGAFRPMPKDTKWGAKWEYGWFRGTFTLPPEAAGQRIAMRADAGGESAVWINGRLVGAVDRQHTEITLAMAGKAGARYDVLIEAYAGHGLRTAGKGPVGYGRESVPEPPPAQVVVGETTFGIWNEPVYQLWLDVETILQTRNQLDPDSLRVAEIDAGLRDFTLIADPELPPAEFLATVEQARARLKPLLTCVNGSTAPTLFAIGHSHIDVAWLWPLQETERKMARTISTQLALMDEYPEFKFIQSQPHLFWMLQRRYPAKYAEVKAAIQAGKIVPEGGMWIEADTNVSGGEALIRQFVAGKRFFKQEFGVGNQLMWLPDVFGYSGAMPQIMRGCGIKYFATQKIFWTYNGGDPFPYNTFTWEGIDGSGVLAHIFNDYNSLTDPNALCQRWKQRVQKDGISTILLAFGYGDGGGGPTRNHLEFLRRATDLEGLPKVKMASPIEFFQDQERRGIPKERYVGELYFQAHRGTYTSQAKTKKGNRKSELALREAEMWSTVALALGKTGDRKGRPYTYPTATLEEVWRTVLLNQFHDILPGSSIHRVYEEAEASYAEAIKLANGVAGEAQAVFTKAGDAVTVFNSLSWQRRVLTPLPSNAMAATDVAGQSLPVQVVGGQAWAEVNVPACGWTTVNWKAESDRQKAEAALLKASAQSLENEYLKVEFNDQGEITSIWDKEAGRELATGPCNSLKMYKDVPGAWDAWDIDSMYGEMPVEMPEKATISVAAAGPLVVTLRVARKLHHSTMTQEISLRRGSRRVDFATTVDWRESHKMLKVAFPVNVHANEAIHEIQFGHIRRPNHTSRPFDANRFEVCNHKWSALAEENRGCAVLNDCKYGLNVLGNSINLTLLKSALAPDMTADKGIQTFTYSFYAWNGSLADSNVVREAYELNVPATTVAGAGGEQSLFSVDAPNIIVETVKPAEDGSGDVIVRLYEAKHMATRATLTTALPIERAAVTNMLEEFEADLPCASGKIALEFRPFEIKTVRFTL
jgi:alpha-mannosidase